MRFPFALVLLLIAVGALAAEQPVEQRFEIAPADTGATRLDTQTGAVARCQTRNGEWTCTPVPAAATPSVAVTTAKPSQPAALRAAAGRAIQRLLAMVSRLKHPHPPGAPRPAVS
jgi:hypothetical protein